MNKKELVSLGDSAALAAGRSGEVLDIFACHLPIDLGLEARARQHAS